MFDVFGFYKFIKVSYLKKNQKILQNQLLNKNIRGTIIISNEGLNGTISGKNKDIKLIKDYLHKLFKFEKFDSINNSKSTFQPFHKPKVKIKKEVVPMNLSLKNYYHGLGIIFGNNPRTPRSNSYVTNFI